MSAGRQFLNPQVCSHGGMESSSKFKDAFESIALTVDKAASLPQHQERVEPLVVTTLSNRGEIQVTVADAKVRSLMFQDYWFEVVTSDEASDLITESSTRRC